MTKAVAQPPPFVFVYFLGVCGDIVGLQPRFTVFAPCGAILQAQASHVFVGVFKGAPTLAPLSRPQPVAQPLPFVFVDLVRSYGNIMGL